MGLSEAVRDSFVPPRTWSAWRRQGAQALLVAAVLLAVLAVVAHDVPWTLVAIMLVLSWSRPLRPPPGGSRD